MRYCALSENKILILKKTLLLMKTLKRFLPYIIAFLIFILIPVIYFAPQYSGKAMRQFDNVQAVGMYSAVVDHVDKYDEHPSWIANMFGGMPSYAIHLDRPTDIIKTISNYFYFLGDPAAYYFMLMAGFFIMLLCFGVNPWLSIIGAIAYGLSTYFIIIFQAGHIMKIIALCYVPPLIGTIYYTYKKSFWIGAPLFGIFTVWEIASVHPQISYYFVLTIVIMVIALAVQAYKNKQVRSFFISSLALLITGFLAIGANSVYLYYTYDYTQDSTRGKAILMEEAGQNAASQKSGLDKDYITAWSYGKMETFNLFIPNLMGGKSNGGFSSDGEVNSMLRKYANRREADSITAQLPGYWGPQPMTSGPVYIGAVMIFLFVLGLFIVKGPNLWWVIGATSLAIILAWGKHFMGITDLFIDYFPLYNKFRTVSMILVVVELTVPLMGMLALNKIWNGDVPKEVLKKSLLKSLYITGGIALFFILFGGMIFSFANDVDYGMGMPEDVISAMHNERQSMMQVDALRSLLFVTLTFGLVWFLMKNKLSKNIFIGSMIVLVLIDMIPIAVRHVDYSMFSEKKETANKSPMTNIDREILKDSDINYRVANLALSTFNDATTSIYHRSIGGYFAAKPRRYQDIIDQYLSKMDMGVYNMLNTKYFIVKDDKGALGLRTNDAAFGNAWVANKIEFVDTPNQEINSLGLVDLSNTAVVSNEFKSSLGNINLEPNINDKVTQVEYKANKMVYKSSLAEDRLIVLSEVYYPKGWSSTIDGKDVEYIRANYLLNAIVVPKGEHTIEFSFEPPHNSLIRTISVISSTLLLIIMAAGIFITRRKNKLIDKN